MISLDNTYNEKDLKDFDDRVKKNIGNNIDNKNIKYVLEFKFD
jgi:DNA ligase (NAD+)